MVEPPEPTRRGEATWLEPYPTRCWMAGDPCPGPEVRYERREAISLAFVTALQLLPPRQRVLILRDVLGFHASEAAKILDTTEESVTSALERGRAGLQQHLPQAGEREAPTPPGSPAEQALVDDFVRAYGSGDVGALVALLTDDVFVSMPPVPLEWHGRGDVTRFYAGTLGQGGRCGLVQARANGGQVAFGTCVRVPAGARPGAGLLVLDPGRRPDLRPDPLREQRAALVRAAAVASRLTGSAAAGR